MTNLTFDPEHTLSGCSLALEPRDAIRMGIALCEAVEHSVGADGVHGSVWPGNITVENQQAVLGPVSSVRVSELSPDALEFLAPEQFWNGKTEPASDVYAIGLLLYTALNHGVMPFFAPGETHTPEARANALQNRMKGKELPPPAAAGRELAAVIAKAAAFQAEERYSKPAALKLALEALSDGAAIPAAVPIVPMTEDEIQNAHSYKVDKDFEKVRPDREKPSRKKPDKGAVDENMDARKFRANPKPKRRWLLPCLLIAVIVVAAVCLLRGCEDGKSPFDFISEPTAPPISTDDVLHSPVPEFTPTASETPEPTPEPTPQPTPEPTPEPKPQFELIMADVTWEEAKALCEAKGGHLAAIRTEEEYQQITEMAATAGATYVWLGAYRAANGHWYYVTGDAMSYTAWDKGEPSAMDMDGTPEDYLLLWYRKNQNYWSYNDMRNDPIAVARASYSGKLAYVCEYDN